MRLRTSLILSVILIAGMAGVSVWGWTSLPAGARVAIHWGLDGRPNGYASKDWAMLLLPSIAVLITGLFAAIPSIEPRRANLAASKGLYHAAWIGTLLLLLGVHFISVASSLGLASNPSRWIVAMVAGLIAVVGNYLGKSRSTFLVGLRLPWTLSSDYAWEKSSRIAGRALVASGLLALLADALLGVAAAAVILTTGVVLGTLAAAIASYFYWLHDPNKQQQAPP